MVSRAIFVLLSALAGMALFIKPMAPTLPIGCMGLVSGLPPGDSSSSENTRYTTCHSASSSGERRDWQQVLC